MKKLWLVGLLVAAVLATGCVGLERRQLRPEISSSQLRSLGPEYGPKSPIMFVNEYTATNAVVYLYQGNRQRAEVWPNVGGGNMILSGYIAAYKLQNSPGRSFPVVAGLPRSPILLDADRDYTALVFVYHGGFGKLYCDPYIQFFHTDARTDRDQYNFPGATNSSNALRANYILRVQGSNQSAYPGPFNPSIEIRPTEQIYGTLNQFFQRR